MDKMKKKRIKKYTAWICIVLLVALLALMPLLARSERAADGPQASILTGSAERKDIQSLLIGGGTLAEEDALEITIPAAVKLKEYLVANGDEVREGDPIASVDRVTVMTAITQVQQTLDYLSEEIEAAFDEEVSGTVTAQAGGTVKAVYAQKGDSVREVMLEHGALAVLSLDGLMALRLETDAAITVGEALNVRLADGTETTGRVAFCLDGIAMVTVEDDGYAIGTAAEVTGGDGMAIGSGELYIHSPWNAVAYSGTVSAVRYSEGQTVYAGAALMTLEDTGSTAAYEHLAQQRREYEEMMLELFRMYQSERLAAPGDGVVSGVDEEGAFLLSGEDGNWVLNFLTNAPNGDDETRYQNYVGRVSVVGTDGLVMNMNPQNLSITDYADLSGVPRDPAAMTQSVIYNASVPIYELTGGQWQQIDPSAIGVGDILLFAMDESGNFVWVVRVEKAPAAEEPTTPSEPQQPTEPEPSAPAEPEGPTTPTEPEEPTEPSQPDGEDSTQPTTPTTPSIPGQSGGAAYPQISGSMAGAYFQGGMITEEPEYELYSLETVTVAAVTPQETVTLEITVDELDISGLVLGQEVTVTVDALSGEKFTGFITNIGNDGTNGGGNSKYAVEVTLPHSENMLPGMNATATIVLGTVSNVLTVPVAALNEDGAQTILYTSFDEDDGILGTPVTVSVGASDGEYAEILSGIEEGTTVYYAYYDTLVISADVEAGFAFG